MSSKTDTENLISKTPSSNTNNVRRLKIFGFVLTIFGISLFAYFVYYVGFREILKGIGAIGISGFVVILFIYFLRIVVRSISWKLSVTKPYALSFKDTFPAVIIGEALSSMIPLGILMSGTAKAVAVRKRVPIVAGLSSVATENLFYSLVTALFICFGAAAFLSRFELPFLWVYLVDLIIVFLILAIILGALVVIRQWNWASAICDWLYKKNILRSVLDSGRLQVRLFENLIFAFYRQYPRRFLPICGLQVLFHSLGVFEVWFILSRIGDRIPAISTAFFLESISRLITIVFKLVPLVIGIDEAGAEFITETLAIGVGVGVTLAIIRKGRVLFWAAIGVILIIKRGLSMKEMQNVHIEEK